MIELNADDNVRQQVAGEITDVRKQCGLTQGDLARRLNMSQQNISEIESGNRDLGVKLLSKIASALDARLELNFESPTAVPVQSTDEIIKRVQQTESLFHEYGVSYFMLFGSAVRGELEPDSDIDMVVFSDKIEDYWTLTELRLKLEELLGRDVDLATKPMVEHIWDDEIEGQGVELRAA